jgi:hypothetical protein
LFVANGLKKPAFRGDRVGLKKEIYPWLGAEGQKSKGKRKGKQKPMKAEGATTNYLVIYF